MSDIQDQIQAELAQLSEADLEAELAKVAKRQAQQRARSQSPEAKASRRAYYDKVKDTDEWKAARKVAAAKRKARQAALLALAKEKIDPERLAEIGVSVD